MMSSVLMLDSDLQQRVILFVATSVALDPRTIDLSSRLLHDLGIDGDDASELLTDYSHVFQVDMQEFDFRRHFRSEPNLLAVLHRTTSRLVPVTLRELVGSARLGRWTPEPEPTK
jgi:hypothetical protein